MWNNSELKINAKSTLKRFGYWLAFAVTFVNGFFAENLASSGSGSASSSLTSIFNGEESSSAIPSEWEAVFSDPFFISVFIVGLIFVFVLAIAFGFAMAAFVSGPVVVGKNKFFMEHRAFGSKFSRLFWAFGCGNYLNIAKTMFLHSLKIFLWSLLFIIPGIIKSFEYFMVPYILAENPGIDPKRAFELSKKMTDGEKWKIFLLDLSFIGWVFLGLLTFGIGLYFLQPYYEATFAELYQVMREKAHGLEFSDYNELPGFFPEQP